MSEVRISAYRSKIASLRRLVEIHNSNVELETLKLDADKIVGQLQVIGGTTDYLLTKCTWDDLEQCGLPRLLAREVAGIFRQPLHKQA